MTEHEKAKSWRLKNEWTMAQLSEMIGWSSSAILCMERGISPPTKKGQRDKPVNEHAWFRYKMCCECLERRKGSKKEFDW